MICYKDKTFCASQVEQHTCGRELTEEDQKRADELGLPISYGRFCEVEVIMLPCKECGQILPIKANGVEMQHGLNIFCHDKNCEDLYAAKL